MEDRDLNGSGSNSTEGVLLCRVINESPLTQSVIQFCFTSIYMSEAATLRTDFGKHV